MKQTAAEERPDLIMLDLTFPDADGRQILKDLKADSEVAHTPVVIWSGYDPGPNRAVFLALGADDYIEKSDPKQLRGRKPEAVRSCARACARELAISAGESENSEEAHHPTDARQRSRLALASFWDP